MENNTRKYEKDTKRDSKNIDIKSALGYESMEIKKTLFTLTELKDLRLEIENNIWDLKEKIKNEEKKEHISKLREELKEGDSCLLCGEMYKQKASLEDINKNNIKELRERLNNERRRYENIQDIIISEI